MSKVVPFKLTVVMILNGTGGFTAFCPEIHGAISEGKTEDEAFENLKDAAMGLMAMRAEMELEKKKWKRVTRKATARKPMLPAWVYTFCQRADWMRFPWSSHCCSKSVMG